MTPAVRHRGMLCALVATIAAPVPAAPVHATTPAPSLRFGACPESRGPGGPGLACAVTKRAKPPESVRRSYGVIGFDPLGTGRTAHSEPRLN